MATATTTDWLYRKYMYYILRGQPWTPTTTVQIALYTTAPGPEDGSSGQEVPQNDNTKYKRVVLDASPANWTTANGADMAITNKTEIVFPVPGTAGWGTIVACGIISGQFTSQGQPTGGQEFAPDPGTAGQPTEALMWVGRIATPKAVASGDGAPRILVGQLKITRASCG